MSIVTVEDLNLSTKQLERLFLEQALRNAREHLARERRRANAAFDDMKEAELAVQDLEDRLKES